MFYEALYAIYVRYVVLDFMAIIKSDNYYEA